MHSPRPVHPQVGAPKPTRESVTEKESQEEGEHGNIHHSEIHHLSFLKSRSAQDQSDAQKTK